MVLEQECEVTMNSAIENYNNELKEYFANRTDPLDTEELFQTLRMTRDKAIDEFIVFGEIRDKSPHYFDYLYRLQEFMNSKEEKIIEINENLADELFK